LKATNIIDFWLRWHMTLTRFLTAYIYNPLVLWLTRRRMARKLPGLGGHAPSVGAYFQLLAGPTLLTMFVSGLWHGAGYLFILWGLLHGVYLCINHAWRFFGPRIWINKETYERFMRPAGFVLTFLSVAVAMVLFRSANLIAAKDILHGLAGLNGISVPQHVYALLGPLTGFLHSFVSASTDMSAHEFFLAMGWLGVALVVALLCPNTLQIMARYEPALGVHPAQVSQLRLLRPLRWTPTVAWAIAMSPFVVAAVMKLGGKSEFLYWQF
jgi:D-alanyl-lipoteichoic acid acyltransferase DltB (MBOAT superfamily)